MVWRSVLCLLLWLAIITVLLFPQLCPRWALCEPTPLPLAVFLGMVCAGIALFDGRRVLANLQTRRRGRSIVVGRSSNES